MLAYFAMTKGLRFLLDLIPGGAAPLITIDSYLGYALAMVTIFGIAFELPLAFVLLNLAHILPHERFAKWRRMIIFAVFAFFNDRRRARLLAADPFPGLTAEEVAEFNLDEQADPAIDAGQGQSE